MKQLLELILRFIPIIAIVIISYLLFLAPDSAISEGMKNTLSALLGAIASYLFIQYSEFIKQIDSTKAKYITALTTLEVKLNDQLNWLSDIEYHLNGHIKLVKQVINGSVQLAFDSSTYRDPVNIESEIYSINNIGIKNELLSLHTQYKKINNDLRSMQEGYRFMLDKAVSDPNFTQSYKDGLPRYLDNVNTIFEHTKSTFNKTKNCLSSCRVLSKDSRNLSSSIRRYFVLHDDPQDYEKKRQKDKAALEIEIATVGNKSNQEISDISNRINKSLNEDNKR